MDVLGLGVSKAKVRSGNEAHHSVDNCSRIGMRLFRAMPRITAELGLENANVRRGIASKNEL